MSQAESPHASMNGAYFAMIAVFCFSLNDVLVKSLSSTYALHQIVLFRSLVALALVLLAVGLFGNGLSSLKTKRLGGHLLRGAFVVAANMAFFLGLAAMPLAEAVAIFFVSPLIITVFSVIFLGETVGPRRWIAIAVGFIGVLVIMRPGTAAFEPASILPIIAALCYAGLHMMTRRLGTTESAQSLVFYIQLLFIVVTLTIGLAVGDGRFADQEDPSLAFFFREWIWPRPEDLMTLLAIGFILFGGAYFISQAYRVSEAAIVAPFEYIAMPLSIFWGIVIFNEWPDGWSWAGMALIIGSGLFLLWREHRVGQDTAASGPKYRR
ncbi:MAG: DMT family transporter [Pseudomonadota bacterium]